MAYRQIARQEWDDVEFLPQEYSIKDDENNETSGEG